MQIVSVQIDVPKETKEIADALCGIVADAKAKKPVTEIAAAALPRLITAFDGYDQADDEFKSDKRAELIAYLVLELQKALI